MSMKESLATTMQNTAPTVRQSVSTLLKLLRKHKMMLVVVT